MIGKKLLFTLFQSLNCGTSGYIMEVGKVCQAWSPPTQERAGSLTVSSTQKQKGKSCWKTISRKTQLLASALSILALAVSCDGLVWMSGDLET